MEAQNLYLGAFYTPFELARAIVANLGDGPNFQWLEPSFGDGAFLKAIAERNIPSHRISAVELSEPKGPANDLAETHMGTDFIQWARSSRNLYDRVVANPPYVALSKLPTNLKSEALSRTYPVHGHLRGTENYWVAFLGSVLEILADGASIAFLLPASWDYADYSRNLRHLLPRQFHTFEVHRSLRPLFQNVEEGVVLIIGRGYRHEHSRSLRFEYDSIEDLVSSLERRKLPKLSTMEKPNFPLQKGVRLGDLLKVRIGAVTGDSSYFLLTETQRVAHKLPVQNLRPVLSRSGHLRSAQIDNSTWRQLLQDGERVWLLAPKSTLADKHLLKYLDWGKSEGCNLDAYKIRNRHPWHSFPVPEDFDAFLSGMSRSGPWLALRASPEVTASNTLYIGKFHSRFDQSSQSAVGLSMLTFQVRHQVERIGRRYAGGLMKLEPSDLESLILPPMREGQSLCETYKLAIKLLLSGDLRSACLLAEAHKR